MIEYNKDTGQVNVDWPKKEGSCIQLEVQYRGNQDWQKCGECISSSQTVTLSTWCSPQQRRRRQAAGVVESVRAKLCYENGGICGEPLDARKGTPTLQTW